MSYTFLKICHIISFVAWFAGIFYIWRLFVYHAAAESREVKETFEVMEYKLYKYIMMPAMISTLLFGVLLFYQLWNIYYAMWWIWIKIFFVGINVFLHFLSGYYRVQLKRGKTYRHRRFRILNEMPTILLILIVTFAVWKAF